jgi:hypothetical protein
MLGQIQRSRPEDTLDKRGDPARDKENEGGQQESGLGEYSKIPKLCEEEDEHGKTERSGKQLIVLKHAHHLPRTSLQVSDAPQ